MSVEKLLKKFQEAAERPGETIEMGDLVICDSCNKDWTKLEDPGGFIFGSKAVCPDCAEKYLERVKGYGEEEYIRAKCPAGKSFADFVREYRGPHAGIRVDYF